MRKLLLIGLLSFYGLNLTAQKTVRYDLFVKDTVVNYSGKRANAIAINGQIPSPTLYFTEGDTAEIYLHNLLDEPTAFHWHGVLLPNAEDGVSYLTTAPIPAHSTHVFKFPIIQNGTYWYHAHTMQEQVGLYGALVFYKKNEKPEREYTLVLSDWTDENPIEVYRSLKFANDWYSIKKHSTQNWGEAIIKGHFGTKVTQEWKRMFPMDVSDVYYDAFLANGKKEQYLPSLKAGDKIKLRIVNGSSSTYFWLQFAGGQMTVASADGNGVEPVNVDRMLIAVAETYDVIVTVPENKCFEFKATAEDRTNSTSVWLGDGDKIAAPVLPTLNYFAGMKMMNGMMKFNGNMKEMGMQMSNQQMDMNTVMYPESKGKEIVTLNYTMLKATKKTTLPDATTKVIKFNLTGNMNRYLWSINNVVISDTDKILIKKGENVRIILSNQSMMRHPMHLHGHEFRVLNGQGDYAPLKNMIDIMPMETDTIEFAARYDGDWFFHCHLLYHMMSGMGRVFHYENSQPNIQVDTIKNSWKKFLEGDNMFNFSGSIAAQSQGVWAKAILMNRNYVFDATGNGDYKGDYETETHFARYLDKNYFLKIYVGSDIRMLNELNTNTTDAKTNSEENRTVATFGIQYLLPFFIQTDMRIDHTGHYRFQVSRNDFALTSRLRFDALWNTDKEYEIGMRYIITKRFSLSGNYDSHYGGGGGILFTY